MKTLRTMTPSEESSWVTTTTAPAVSEAALASGTYESATGSSALPATPAEVTTCVHWWVVEPPNGPTSAACCKRCGATSTFSNSEPAGLNDTISEKRLRAGAAMRRRSQAQKAAFLGDVAENSEGQWL